MNKAEVLKMMRRECRTAAAFAEDGAFMSAARKLRQAAVALEEFQAARNEALERIVKEGAAL
jgi:hypothetical protein